MAQILRLRVILDTEEDVFRDIEIETDAPLMHLHFAVLDAFGWEAGEMASFFIGSYACVWMALMKARPQQSAVRVTPKLRRPAKRDACDAESTFASIASWMSCPHCRRLSSVMSTNTC